MFEATGGIIGPQRAEALAAHPHLVAPTRRRPSPMRFGIASVHWPSVASGFCGTLASSCAAPLMYVATCADTWCRLWSRRDAKLSLPLFAAGLSPK